MSESQCPVPLSCPFSTLDCLFHGFLLPILSSLNFQSTHVVMVCQRNKWGEIQLSELCFLDSRLHKLVHQHLEDILLCFFVGAVWLEKEVGCDSVIDGFLFAHVHTCCGCHPSDVTNFSWAFARATHVHPTALFLCCIFHQPDQSRLLLSGSFAKVPTSQFFQLRPPIAPRHSV